MKERAQPTTPARPVAHESQPAMRDIAIRAGVSISTVSLALSGKPQVAEPTREKILKIARQLGYRKNPYVTALMVSRRRRTTPNKQPVLAFLTFHDTRDGWREEPYMAYYTPAKREAEELGYRLDPFWATDPAISPARLGKILYTRGVCGVLLDTPPRRGTRLEMDWAPFSVVALGAGLQSPVVHRVAADTFHIAREAVKRCAKAGYRRIGLKCRQLADDRLQHRWFGAYLAELHCRGLCTEIPPFMENTFTVEEMVSWIKRYKLDAIVGTQSNDLIEQLERNGVRIPQEVAYLSISLREPNKRFSGYIERLDLVARTAVQNLIAMINRNETGIPEVACESFLLGTWNPGQTFREKTPNPQGRTRGSPRAATARG